MTIKQLSVFLENREGRLDEVLQMLGANDVNIVALSLADTADYGMLRMIVSDPKKDLVVKANAETRILEIQWDEEEGDEADLKEYSVDLKIKCNKM